MPEEEKNKSKTDSDFLNFDDDKKSKKSNKSKKKDQEKGTSPLMMPKTKKKKSRPPSSRKAGGSMKKKNQASIGVGSSNTNSRRNQPTVPKSRSKSKIKPP